MTLLTSTIGDDILRWASENGSGNWVQLSEAIAHAAGARGVRHARGWALASDLSDLGHIDIDWELGRWSAAQPCLVVSEGLGLCAYLAGWRTSLLLGRFDAAADDLDIFPFDVDQPQAPKAVFAKCGTVESVEELGQRLKVPVQYDPCSTLAGVVTLPSGTRQLGAPPPPDEDLARFDADGLRFLPVSGAQLPGLYRFEVHGRRTFRLLDDGEWYIVDRSEGQLHVLAGRDDVIRWHVPSRDVSTPRVMSVARDVSLPPLASRAAVAASGLLPIDVGGRRLYRNVPRAAAASLAKNLGLELSVSNDPIKMEF